jgi:predicted CXXCH cytochrome family protein
MRKLGLLIIVVTTLALVPAICSAGSIVSTAHDLSGAGYGTDQICVFCHTPHNAKSPQLAPLWNHGSTAATFTLYSSPSLTAVPGQPANNSKACLSCHDGTVAVDTYGSQTGTNNITGTALLGTDLSDDHPISFTYDAALATADGGLVTPASASSVVAGIPLYASTLQCASCHDVHDNDDAPFLRNTNAGSALCLKCHVK